MMQQVLIGCGSSMGIPELNIRMARSLLSVLEETQLVKQSQLYRSTPLGKATALFINQCCVIETNLTPQALLRSIQDIECTVGRRRSQRWMDRIIDIDILLYGDQIIEHDTLKIPHQELLYRSFVLQPACEIAGSWLHPIYKTPLNDFRIPKPRSWKFALF